MPTVKTGKAASPLEAGLDEGGDCPCTIPYIAQSTWRYRRRSTNAGNTAAAAKDTQTTMPIKKLCCCFRKASLSSTYTIGTVTREEASTRIIVINSMLWWLVDCCPEVSNLGNRVFESAGKSERLELRGEMGVDTSSCLKHLHGISPHTVYLRVSGVPCRQVKQ